MSSFKLKYGPRRSGALGALYTGYSHATVSMTVCVTESRLRGPPRTAREPQDQLPVGGDDDPGSRHHHPREASQLRLPAESCALQEVLHALQTL